MSSIKAKSDSKKVVESTNKGGRGYKLRGYENGISTPHPAPTTSPSITQQANTVLSTHTASTYHPTTVPNLLPTGTGITKPYQQRLKQLASLYEQLKQTEAALTLTATYLPKLKAAAGQYLTDAMAEHRNQLKAKIAALATPAESSSCPPSLKKSK